VEVEDEAPSPYPLPLAPASVDDFCIEAASPPREFVLALASPAHVLSEDVEVLPPSVPALEKALPVS
jgi:hypothetical protein